MPVRRLTLSVSQDETDGGRRVSSTRSSALAQTQRNHPARGGGSHAPGLCPYVCAPPCRAGSSAGLHPVVPLRTGLVGNGQAVGKGCCEVLGTGELGTQVRHPLPGECVEPAHCGHQRFALRT